VRLLQTLEHEGLVKHAPQYGAYYLTSDVTELSSGFHSEPRIWKPPLPSLMR
jgi:IclR family mhp operon transcriptional activator